MDDELLIHLHQNFARLLAGQVQTRILQCGTDESADFQIGPARRNESLENKNRRSELSDRRSNFFSARHSHRAGVFTQPRDLLDGMLLINLGCLGQLSITEVEFDLHRRRHLRCLKFCPHKLL